MKYLADPTPQRLHPESIRVLHVIGAEEYVVAPIGHAAKIM
jgi:hypothetical protein